MEGKMKNWEKFEKLSKDWNIFWGGTIAIIPPTHVEKIIKLGKLKKCPITVALKHDLFFGGSKKSFCYPHLRQIAHLFEVIYDTELSELEFWLPPKLYPALVVFSSWSKKSPFAVLVAPNDSPLEEKC
jgi:hypothetical protein